MPSPLPPTQQKEAEKTLKKAQKQAKAVQKKLGGNDDKGGGDDDDDDDDGSDKDENDGGELAPGDEAAEDAESGAEDKDAEVESAAT